MRYNGKYMEGVKNLDKDLLEVLAAAVIPAAIAYMYINKGDGMR